MMNFSQLKEYAVERRKTPRYKVRFFGVFRMLSQTIYGSIIDISRTGIGLVLSHEPVCNEPLDCRIRYSLGNTEKTDLHLMGSFLWRNGIVINSMYRAGMEIGRILPDYHENFKDCITDLEQI